ncbi:DUF1367 family protein [Salmonella enterica subsp. enterica]|nr:DUF1367 family protein [Salmonella enterica]EEI1253472.1 DUF1367 family protein [Salmonella enterica subsp. enterica]EEL2516757.1 DUF1367 family protein [Salmonella enterica]EEO4172614.1 DUF1367 family protein [Salmonella enterica subsp. enterica]EIO8741042.1 DUF1367 family protein [Salmonella enterica]
MIYNRCVETYLSVRSHFENTRSRIPESIAFIRMDEGTFRQLYKDVFNVLWSFIPRHKFRS